MKNDKNEVIKKDNNTFNEKHKREELDKENEIKKQYQKISNDLKEIVSLIKNGQNSEDKRNIYEYVLYPNYFNTNQLRLRIFEVFKIKSNNEAYSFLLAEILKVFQKEESSKINQNITKEPFYNIITFLNYFINPSLIYYPLEPNIFTNSFKVFNKYIINDNKITKEILDSFINIFNLRNKLFEQYSINRNSLISIKECNKIIWLIDLLNLHNIFSFKYIIQEKIKIFYSKNSFIYEMYNTYNRSLNELLELTHYISLLETNCIPPLIIEKIIFDNKIKNKINTTIKDVLIEKLMEKPSNKKEEMEKNSNQFLSYYHVLFDNKKINEKSTEEIINIQKLFEFFLNKKEFLNCKTLVNLINPDIITKIIPINLMHKFCISVSIKELAPISNSLMKYPNEIETLLNKSIIKDSIKFIKAINLNRENYDRNFDVINMKNYFQYKTSECFKDQFDILIDYGLINQTSYNVVIDILMKRLKNLNKNTRMISLKEEDEEQFDENEINDNKVNNNNIKGYDDFDKLINYFAKESKKYNKSKEKNEISNIENLQKIHEEKIILFFKEGKKKKYLLNKDNKATFNKLFRNKSLNVSLINYIPEDVFEPHDKTCLTIDPKKTKVFFIDNLSLFKEIFANFFDKSKYIGIDSEWRQQFYANNNEKISILQLSNNDCTTVMIIDLLKLNNDSDFQYLFGQLFSNKIFIGYSFKISDIEHFSDSLQEAFNKAKIIDLIDIYQYKYIKKAPSLKGMCLEFLGKELCKYEQCSNWDNRPLKKSQLHYASLDALVCISIYHKLTSNNI